MNQRASMEEHLVFLKELSLKQVLEKKLIIPPYQRAYCWEEEQISILLMDIDNCIKKSKKNEFYKYRIGSIVLRENNDGNVEIIDGLQRITTIVLLLNSLSNNFTFYEELTELVGYNNLLNSQVDSESQENIANAIYVIERRLGSLSDNLNIILNKIEVIVLNLVKSAPIDLAFTFFSNINSRGIKITDYDLLKAHHLRFINENESPIKYAKRWDDMMSEHDSDEKKNRQRFKNGELPLYSSVIDLVLFRLRHFLYYKEWDEDEKNRIKKEFSSVVLSCSHKEEYTMKHYAENVVGGSAFFEFIQSMLEQFRIFKTFPVIESLHNTICGETNYWYRDISEALIFAYYLKFGGKKDTVDPFIVLHILRIVSHDRLTQPRAKLSRIISQVMAYRLVMIIEYSVSIDHCKQQIVNIYQSISALANYQKNSQVVGRFTKKCKKLEKIINRNSESCEKIEMNWGDVS